MGSGVSDIVVESEGFPKVFKLTTASLSQASSSTFGEATTDKSEKSLIPELSNKFNLFRSLN
jgi:hypothetical protein